MTQHRKSRRALGAAVAGISLAILAPPAVAQDQAGSIEAGRAIAQETCVECHVLGRMKGNENPGIGRPFQDIANSGMTELGLRVFFRSPHRDMPNFRFTPQETDDLVAYILSLKGEK